MPHFLIEIFSFEQYSLSQTETSHCQFTEFSINIIIMVSNMRWSGIPIIINKLSLAYFCKPHPNCLAQSLSRMTSSADFKKTIILLEHKIPLYATKRPCKHRNVK